MNILACDPATRFGFAHSSGISGTFDLSVRRDESSGMRLMRLRAKLTEIRQSVPIDLVVFEAARHAAPKMQGALVVQTELQAVIKVWCEDWKIQYIGLSPAEIKKHATGKGNASKEIMLDFARLKFGAQIKDDNEADALWILDLAKTRYATTPNPA